MNTYFSRFLHHTLLYSGLTRISRWNKFANLVDLDTPIKSECDRKGKDASLKPKGDSLCAGRSMVEMLGVLAIIGVLSVGAISGYSKAMMKYRLNKQAEQINQIVNAVSQYHDQIKSDTPISLVPIFKKINLIPVEMIKDDSYNIYDIFGNKIRITSYNYHGLYVANLSYNIDLTNLNNMEVCRNIINTIKENSQSIYYLESIADWDTENAKQKILYGDAYCNKYRGCLNSVSVNDMDNICRGYEKNEDANMIVWWHS